MARRRQIKGDTQTLVFGERAACLLPNNKYFTGLLFVFCLLPFLLHGGDGGGGLKQSTTTTKKKNT